MNGRKEENYSRLEEKNEKKRKVWVVAGREEGENSGKFWWLPSSSVQYTGLTASAGSQFNCLTITMSTAHSSHTKYMSQHLFHDHMVVNRETSNRAWH